MALYNSKDTHYDLLVREDSRLAQVGLLAGAGEGSPLLVQQNIWKTVKSNKKSVKDIQEEEELLVENEDKDTEIDEELEEEITLLRGKENGQRRSSPQANAENVQRKKKSFQCNQCDNILESQSRLNAHIKSQHNHETCFTCDICAL